MKKLYSVVFVLLMSLAIQFFSGFQVVAAELGVGFRVVPTGGKVGGNNQLWFALDRGESGVRQIEVISSSDIKQLIQLTFVQAQTVDGQPVAGNEPSEIASWITTSENNFILNPKSSKLVEIRTKVPSATEDGTYRAYLKVGASAAKISNGKNNQTQAIVRNAISFNKELYVLVGDAETLTLDFEILSLQDFTDDDGFKHISVEFENSGQLPLGLKANLTLVSTEFTNLSYGPFIAGSTPILENGDKGFADFKLPTEVEPGNYRILIQASQESIIKNKVFEKNLTFPKLGGFKLLPALFGIFLLVIAVFMIRFGFKKFRNSNSLGIANSKQSKERISSEIEFDVDEFMDQLIAKNQRRREKVSAPSNRTKPKKSNVKKTTKTNANSKTRRRKKTAAVKRVR